MKKLRIIVSGFIGSFCISGITWHYAQYAAGLQLLGHDVYYVEDTCGVNCYYDPAYEWGDPTPVVKYMAGVMDFFGLKDRWAYRDEGTGKYFGLPPKKIKDICSSADILISVSNSIFLREEYKKIPIRILVDTDPMFTQAPDGRVSKSVDDVKSSFLEYTHHFSFGENIMSPDSVVPTYDITWYPTRQPVCLDYWKNIFTPNTGQQRKIFTTILNLASKDKIHFNDEDWGQKDVELDKIVELPKRINHAGFELLMAGYSRQDREHDWLRQKGWQVSDKLSFVNEDLINYRDYIKQSYGEFSVAKETYVKANTGWFSDRSACYLAAGRPVILQETQWSKYIPAGKGLLAFSDLETACQAIEEVLGNYPLHAKAASQIASEYFDSDKVLNNILMKLS